MRNKTLKYDRVETYFNLSRAHATQEAMHMSASPWIIVRKGKNAVRVSYPAHTESLNNPPGYEGKRMLVIWSS